MRVWCVFLWFVICVAWLLECATWGMRHEATRADVCWRIHAIFLYNKRLFLSFLFFSIPCSTCRESSRRQETKRTFSLVQDSFFELFESCQRLVFHKMSKSVQAVCIGAKILLRSLRGWEVWDALFRFEGGLSKHRIPMPGADQDCTSARLQWQGFGS